MTLGYVDDYSYTSLTLRIGRKSTLRHIRDSTNNDLVKEQIGYLDKIYPGSLDQKPSAQNTDFSVVDYIKEIKIIMKLRVMLPLKR